MATIPNVADLVATLEENAPEVYTKCFAQVVDKKGKMVEKKCIINLKTGDVFKNRALRFSEKTNYCLVRKYVNKDDKIEHYAYSKAQVFDGNIVLTTWVFADGYNNPGTTNIDWTWGDDSKLDQRFVGDKVDANALFNVKLSKPRIAAMVMVAKDRTVYSWDNIDEYGLLKSVVDRDPNFYLSRTLIEAVYNAYEGKRVVGLLESFKSMFNIGYVGANKYVTFDNSRDVSLFMKSPMLEKKLSKNQTKIDDLIAISIPDHNNVGMIDQMICYADKVNDEWVVLRWYRKLGMSTYTETARMYVNKTEAIHCRNNLQGSWVYAASKIKSETFNADKIFLQSADVFDGTKLEYFKNISTTIGNQSAALYMLTMYPEFEKLCKSGFDWLCDLYLTAPWQMSWKHFLSERIGSVDWGARNILKFVGVNRHQAEKITTFRSRLNSEFPTNYYWERRQLDDIIYKLKSVFGVSSLNSIDNDTFDYIIDSLTSKERLLGCYVSGLKITFDMYHNDAIYFIKDLNAAMEERQTVVTQTRWGYTSEMSTDRLYMDTMRMIQAGQYMDIIRPRFSSVNELLHHHDVMTDLINADQAAHQARLEAQYNNGFITNQSRWKKWEWSEDDTFCVIAPTAPVDVAVEGITLRHCVKSYIPSVANGSTNIMFIRRKGNENEPFFTVEVDTSNNIRQVHGMCNCNVNSVEGLADFIQRWSKAKKLKYSQSYANGVRAAR